MIQIERLLVMQEDLRYWNQLQNMIDFVKNNGFWTMDNLKNHCLVDQQKHYLISISRFEDGNVFVHDGNHRVCATWLGGRRYIRNDEYVVSDWKYSDYTELVEENNWYTPFDPRTHVRTADFYMFKKEAKDRFKIDPEGARTWVFDNLDRFTVPRSLNYIVELAMKNSSILDHFLLA